MRVTPILALIAKILGDPHAFSQYLPACLKLILSNHFKEFLSNLSCNLHCDRELIYYD